MPDQPGTSADPLRVAIVGSGPAGFYAAEHLLKQDEVATEVDVFDRLPTPFGLVRAGVAPDHPKIKSVIRVYEKTAARDGFRFFGNVEIGVHLSAAELAARYHAVVYAYGTPTDRHLGIPGEELPGSHAATAFVAWYNAHPDFADLEFDLSCERAVVIGNGNVAADLARMLALSASIAWSAVSVSSSSSLVRASMRARSVATLPFPITTARSQERSNSRSAKSGWALYQATKAVAAWLPGSSSPGIPR